MAEYDRTGRNKIGDSDQQHSMRQKESEPSLEKSFAWDEGKFLLTKTPFAPRMEEHSITLFRLLSGKQQHDFVSQMQQTYGNRYVQHLFEHIPFNVVQQSRLNQEPSLIQRSPAKAASKGTISIPSPANDPYDVIGTTLEEVGAQLDPVEWGCCTWEWNYGYRTTEGISDRINITLVLTIRLPRWRGDGWRRAPSAVKAEWNRMLDHLRAHENHHASIARKWAELLQDKLLNQPEGDLETRWTEGKAEHQAEQDTYDTDTQHGETEGVTLDTSIE